MSKEQTKENLASLISDVKEHLIYLQELGAENVDYTLNEIIVRPVVAKPSQEAHTPLFSKREPQTKQSVKQSPPPPQSAKEHLALMRNALAETSLGNKKSSAQKDSSKVEAKPSSVYNNETKNLETKPQNMAKKEKETKAPILTGDSLFGDITPANELPASNETFEDIHRDIGDCTRCPLWQGRTNIVHSEGNPKSRLMFVGEAPGADEDAQARPFVGRAGQLLNKIIEAIGMKREEVFIGNINRCRPPGNRTPTTEEAETCKPFLIREIAVVRPDVIVVLGNTAMKNLLNTKEGITKLRGTFQDYYGVKVMPTFHPAYLLRDPSKKRETWEDMKKVRDYLKSVED